MKQSRGRNEQIGCFFGWLGRVCPTDEWFGAHNHGLEKFLYSSRNDKHYLNMRILMGHDCFTAIGSVREYHKNVVRVPPTTGDETTIMSLTPRSCEFFLAAGGGVEPCRKMIMVPSWCVFYHCSVVLCHV